MVMVTFTIQNRKQQKLPTKTVIINNIFNCFKPVLLSDMKHNKAMLNIRYDDYKTMGYKAAPSLSHVDR